MNQFHPSLQSSSCTSPYSRMCNVYILHIRERRELKVSDAPVANFISQKFATVVPMQPPSQHQSTKWRRASEVTEQSEFCSLHLV